MMNAGMNTDRMQSKARESRHGRGVAGVQHRRGHIVRVSHLHVHIFDGHRRLIDEDADGEGHTAQRHDVDGIARQPQTEQRPEQGQRYVGTTTMTLRGSRRKMRIIKPVRTAPIKPFRGHAFDRRQHRGRLVKFEADIELVLFLGVAFFPVLLGNDAP